MSRTQWNFRLILITVIAVACVFSMIRISHGQQYSVLITPRTTLDVQQVEQQPQPQVQYVQPQQQVVYQGQQPSSYDPWQRYLRLKMWERATYERRGILFPRYIRRPDATQRQMMLWYIWNQRQ